MGLRSPLVLKKDASCSDGRHTAQTDEQTLVAENTIANTDTLHLEKLPTYWKHHHAFPSMAKLCEVVGMASTASAFDIVSRMEGAGYVQRVEGRIAPAKRPRLSLLMRACSDKTAGDMKLERLVAKCLSRRTHGANARPSG
jgi:hypothetical protein